MNRIIECFKNWLKKVVFENPKKASLIMTIWITFVGFSTGIGYGMYSSNTIKVPFSISEKVVCEEGETQILIHQASNIGNSYTACVTLIGPKYLIHFFCVVFFIFSIIVYFYAHYIREEDSAEKAKKKETELEESTDKRQKELDELIRTMPPQNILKSFSAIYKELTDGIGLMKICKAEKDLKKYKIELLRYCLDSIIVVAREYNCTLGEERFAVNIMLIKYINQLDPDRADIIENLLKFSDFSNFDDLKKCHDRYLELKSDWSSSTIDGKSLEADHKLLGGAFALPVPQEYRNKHGKINALPGAPSAFMSKGRSNFFLTHELRDSTYQYSLGSKAFDGLYNYFENKDGLYIKSILSIRLESPGSDKPVGILNIHSNTKEMFSNSKHLEAFLELITPLTLAIYELIGGDSVGSIE